ncbi:MAG TPA: hypothetical protein ENG92_03225 [Thiolapillus brandeum]|uniref:DUF3352 domain-containing protein n=1 Tax=Thiolapillus brandeum TaxID=1076588 RepID=A0A831JXA0_9GAMM|nr:hypothetical protein [Thiolapillus brandeum]
MKLSYGKLNKYLLAAVVAVTVAACSDSEKAQQAEVEKAVAEFDLLSMVPADTPYVAASSRNMPGKLSEKVLKASAGDLDNGSLRAELGKLAALESASESKKNFFKLADALLAELEGKMNTAGLASLGLPINGRSLVYGLGILPVAWMEILDAEKVEAFLTRIEQRSGMQAEKAMRGEISYRRFGLGDLVGILAVNKQYLVMAILPAKTEAEMLSLVFGETRPEKSLADTGSFKEFTRERKFLGYGDGYVDLVRFTEMALGESQGINAAVLQAMGVQSSDLSPACRSFIKTTVASVPLVSFGFTEATNQKYAIKATLETSAGVAGWLQKMSAPVPGVGLPNDGMVSFGVGFDLPQIRDGIKAMLRTFQETGKGCELVDKQGLAQAMQGVDMMFNPMLAGIKGFNLTVNKVEVDPQTMTPKSVDAQLLLSAVDPKGMFSMLGMFNPQLAQLDIPTDGTPVKVPLENMSPMAPPAYAAIKGEALALKVGDKAQDGINTLLSAPVADVPPLFSMSYDAGRLFETIGPAMQNMVQSLQGEDAEDLQSAYDSLQSAASIYSKIDVQVLGTERGFEVDTEINLK